MAHPVTQADVEWLDRFLVTCVFGPQPDDVARARRILAVLNHPNHDGFSLKVWRVDHPVPVPGRPSEVARRSA